MDITCISDLHGHYPKLDGGDLLIVAGDLTSVDGPYERLEFLEWLANQKYRKKVWIAGNHDNSLVGQTFRKTREDAAEYLCDSGTEFEGLKIWGSPWTTRFKGMHPRCMAFTVDTDEELPCKFCQIPIDTDIVITHSPPIYILDQVDNGLYGENKSVGSFCLGSILKRIKPRLHAFGHIHESYGQAEGEWESNGQKTIFINSSHVNERYEPVNKPIRIEL